MPYTANMAEDERQQRIAELKRRIAEVTRRIQDIKQRRRGVSYPSVYANVETPTPGVPGWAAQLGMRDPLQARNPLIEEYARRQQLQASGAAQRTLSPDTEAPMLNRLSAEIYQLGTALPMVPLQASGALGGEQQTPLEVGKGFVEFAGEGVSKGRGLQKAVPQAIASLIPQSWREKASVLRTIVRQLAPDDVRKLADRAKKMLPTEENYKAVLDAIGIDYKTRTPKEAFEDIAREPLTSAAQAAAIVEPVRGGVRLGEALAPKPTAEKAIRQIVQEELPQMVEEAQAATAPKELTPEVIGEAIQTKAPKLRKAGAPSPQLVPEGARLSPTAAELPKPPEPIETPTTALNKTEIGTIREATGLVELPEAEQHKWVQTLNEAKSQKLPDKALEIASEVKATRRFVTDTEHAAMTLKSAELINDYNSSVKTISDLIQQGQKASARLEMRRAEAIQKQLDELTEASDLSGREAARALQIRRMRINLDTYDLAPVMQQARAAKGKNLTPQQMTQFTELVEKHKMAQDALQESESRYQEVLAERDRLLADKVVQIEAKKAKIEARKARLKEKIAAEREDIKGQLRELMGANRVNDIMGVTSESAYLIGRLGVTYIKDGVVNLDALVRQIHADIPGLTDRDIYEALNTRNPKTQAKARSATNRKVAEIKKEAKLLLEIENAQEGITPQAQLTKVRPDTPPRIKTLQKQLAQIRTNMHKTGVEAGRLERANETLNLLQDQLANHYRMLKKQKPIPSPELAEVQANIRQLRQQLRLEDTLFDLEHQLKTGEFKVPEVRTMKEPPPEIQRQQMAVRQARKDIKARIEEMRPWRARRLGVETLNTLRTLKATADMSATLRQGFLLSARRPFTAGKSFAKAVDAFFRENTAEAVDHAIRSADHHYIRQKSGLYLADMDAPKPVGREEYFMSRVMEKIPIVKHIVRASDRHMTTYLNLMRASAFDEFLRKFPNATDAELKAWADWVNVASGRGNLGRLSGGADALGVVFFAPRFAVSRMEAPFGVIRYWKIPKVRNAIAKDMAGAAGVAAMALELAHFGGADVGLDPRSSDFAKIRVGNTRFDLFAGMQQPLRLLFRVAPGFTDRMGWTGKELLPQEKDFDPKEALYRFSSYKLGPGVTLLHELYTGKTIIGTPVTPTETLANQLVFLTLQDVADAYKDGGAWRAAMVAPLVFLGVGANTYERNVEWERRRVKYHIKIYQQTGDQAGIAQEQEYWRTYHPNEPLNKKRK